MMVLEETIEHELGLGRHDELVGSCWSWWPATRSASGSTSS